MSRNQNPFEPQQLDSNPFEPETNTSNPFQHPNDSAFSLESNDTERPGAKTSRGAGYGGGRAGGGRDPELDARIAALEARERAVREREQAVGLKENNWPPFFPMIHHSPNELPEPHRQVGRYLYWQWLALALTLIFNLLGCVFFLIGGHPDGGIDTITAAVYVVFIGATSFFAWYRPIYLGLERTEGRAMAFFFYIYFIFAGFHLLFSAYMFVGIPSTGSAGLINTISAIARTKILASVFGMLSTLGWLFQLGAGGFLYKKIWNFKKGNGEITFQAATDQFKRSTITNILLHQSRV